MAGRFSFSSPGGNRVDRPWFRVGEFEVTTTVLVSALSVFGIILYAVFPDAWFRLVLDPAAVRNLEIWRLVTWPLANEIATSLWGFLTIAIFWYFGREIEAALGRNRFALFLLVVTVIPGVVATILDVGDYGLAAVQFGVFLVFVAEYPHAPFLFGIPAWILGAVLVALNILQLMSRDQPERIVVLIATLATALVTARSMGMAQSVSWIPAVPLGRVGRGGGTSRPKKKRRQRGRQQGDVVAGPWTRNDPTGPSGLRGVPQPPPPPPGPSFADQEALDDLLDKISAQGMDSLTADEKRRLNELSKRMRGPR
jgi:membrane associated rhomboid family serine protease